MILKILKSIEGHIQSNLKVPHPILLALGISTAITVVIMGLYSMVDTGMMGIEDAEAVTKFKPKNGEDDGDGGE